MTSNASSIAPGIDQPRERVTEEQLIELGIDLAQDYPGSTLADFRQYPVLSEGGWFIVIKNQRTLESISRKPWRLLGPINLLSDGLDLT
jgi:hypothetical protein